MNSFFRDIKPEHFKIGQIFWCAGNKWKCTDIGTRVIVAISLEPQTLISSSPNPENPKIHIQTEFTTSEPYVYDGPPYMILETVFDEDDLQGCYFNPEEKE